MTIETSLQVIHSRLIETIDILRDNRKAYRSDMSQYIHAMKYAIATCKVVKAFINEAKDKNNSDDKTLENLYFSKFILHGLNETSYYVPLKLETKDYLLVKDNFEMCIDMLDELIELYNEDD